MKRPPAFLLTIKRTKEMIQEKNIQEIDIAAIERRAAEVRARVMAEAEKCRRKADRLTRAGRHVDAALYIQHRKELLARLEYSENVDEFFRGLKQNPAKAVFIAKATVLAVTSLDLATYYSDMVQAFFSRQGLRLHDEIYTEELIKEAEKAISTLRGFFTQMMEHSLRTEEYSSFDSIEREWREGFTDREKVFYDEYSK